MSMSRLEDRELVKLYLQGREEALVELIDRCKSKVFTHVVLLVKDREVAEDIFQDTFIKVIHTLRTGKYNEEGKFLPWVTRIAHNLAIDYFRRGKKMPMSRSDDEYDVFASVSLKEDTIEDKMIDEQIHNDVRSLIELLPPEQKEVVMMRHYQRMSFKEIAEATNVSINTALGRMRYAVLNMRKIVDEKNIVLTRS
ncbi:MAG: RNA polymerase sigma factor [Cryomorphaceae bacterium]|nr:MAG: RNA polymerase sigma factor [Cryomorphaceae bacterium]